MVSLAPLLMSTNAILFIAVGLILIARVREAKGSLLPAKISVVLATFSAAGTFITEAVSALNYQNVLLVKQLYPIEDLFAMLVLAFLVSFALFATYSGFDRNVVVVLVFLLALIPPAYLTLSYNEAVVGGIDEFGTLIFSSPPLTHILYAICGIPLGVLPILVFARTFLMARKRGDKMLSNRSAIMLSAVAVNEVCYLIYVFGGGIFSLGALIAWIPAAFFLLYAVLKITSSIK
ncbi:MAG: hypothetical protein WED05_12055 [Candidatus Atabeyarchaeum deiterrae]